MFLLVPAHPVCPGQNPQSRKMVVCVCVYHGFSASVRDSALLSGSVSFDITTTPTSSQSHRSNATAIDNVSVTLSASGEPVASMSVDLSSTSTTIQSVSQKSGSSAMSADGIITSTPRTCPGIDLTFDVHAILMMHPTSQLVLSEYESTGLLLK